MIPNLDAGLGERRQDFDMSRCLDRSEVDLGCHGDGCRDTVPRPPARALHDETPGIDECPEAVLQGALWRCRREHFSDLRGCHTIGVLSHRFHDRQQIFFVNTPCHIDPSAWLGER